MQGIQISKGESKSLILKRNEIACNLSPNTGVPAVRKLSLKTKQQRAKQKSICPLHQLYQEHNSCN